MYPWLWLWAPQVHFPWSGAVAQQIQPDLGWFFNGIRVDAGDARVERGAFDIASYGKQIGLLADAVLGQSGRSAVTPERADLALKELESIRLRIEALKPPRTGADAVARLSRQIDELRLADQDAFAELMRRYRLALPG